MKKRSSCCYLAKKSTAVVRPYNTPGQVDQVLENQFGQQRETEQFYNSRGGGGETCARSVAR